MFKLFHKKLNKKGFTLAELLVVVAIIAILVAIAIPIFTNATKEAQKRTNEANIRSVKAFAITNILANWSTGTVTATDKSADHHLSEGANASNYGWVAKAKVDAHGNISDLNLYVANQAEMTPEGWSGVTNIADTYSSWPAAVGTTKGESGNLSTSGNLEWVSIPSDGYYVQVYIGKDEYKTTPAAP